jgi:isoleucyl-tRNA synthetase
VLYLDSADDLALMRGINLAEIAITSGASVSPGPVPEGAFRLPDVAGAGVAPQLAEGEKCARCWMVLPDVGQTPEIPGVCNRCAEAVRAWR